MISRLTSESTINEAVEAFLEYVALERSEPTLQLRKSALKAFRAFLESRGVDTGSILLSEVTERWVGDYIEAPKSIASSTEGYYVIGITDWYRFLVAKQVASIDLERLRSLARPCFSRSKQTSAPSPDHRTLSRVVHYAANLVNVQPSDDRERLRLLRDRALILTLADTDLPVTTVCSLRRGEIDWRNGRLMMPSRGAGSTIVSFSPRCLTALLDYLKARSPLDDASRRAPNSLPLFARHNQSAGKRVLPLSRASVYNIVRQRARETLGAEDDGTVTPVSLRHYFATAVLEPFALLHPYVVQRCRSPFESGRYDDAVFNAMKLVEEEVRSAISADPTDIGVNLVKKAMHPNNPLIRFSQSRAEQESAYFVYYGAIGIFKNPLSHRSMGISDPGKTFECLAFASLLLRMLDEAT